jgi:hypothetical protein
MKLTASQLLLAGAGFTELCSALPHQDSPRQRLLNGLDLPDRKLSSSKSNPYTPDHRDPYDKFVDPVGDDLDPLPWRNGLGASVLGPWNKERSRQSPDMVRPPSTDHGNVANMRWSFADSHIRIEVSYCATTADSRACTNNAHRKEDGPVRPPSASCRPASSSRVST